MHEPDPDGVPDTLGRIILMVSSVHKDRVGNEARPVWYADQLEVSQ